MNEGHVISEEELYHVVELFHRQGPVMGVKERKDQPGHYLFDWLNTPEEFVAQYVTTTIPPKKAFFPPNETLFTFDSGDPPKLTNQLPRQENFVLMGVHPCDLAAIDALDAAYTQPPGEVRWPSLRDRSLIVGMDCMPDEYCFCSSVETLDARTSCDMFLTRIGRGYLLEVHTQKGERFLEDITLSPVEEPDLEEARKWRAKKAEAMTAAFDVPVEAFREILKRGGLTDVWRQVAERCYSCGSCNTTCPTCFCFDIVDDFDAGLQSGVRRRTWDSCQLLDFALVAGGHNFREERWQRVRHRWHRKFLYLYEQFGRPYCTGCGRCSRACTADINIVDVTNRLVAFSKSSHE
jgi:sulfhydrogenase subunit beta (sulfur reductase)